MALAKAMGMCFAFGRISFFERGCGLYYLLSILEETSLSVVLLVSIMMTTEEVDWGCMVFVC
jgi:hypothetical protein